MNKISPHTLALGFVYNYTIEADEYISDEEVNTLKEYRLYNKYNVEGYVNNDFKGEEEDLNIRLDLAFEIINDKLSKADLQELLYEITKLIFADGELDELEETVFGAICSRINLSKEEQEQAMGKYSDELNEKLKSIKQEMAEPDMEISQEILQHTQALGFVYFYTVAADGDISDEEVNTLKEYRLYNKYNVEGSVNDEFKGEEEDLNIRFDLAFEIINDKLSKADLQELLYEINKLIFADGELDELEETVFGAICSRINLSKEEQEQAMGKFSDELNEKSKSIKQEMAEPDIEISQEISNDLSAEKIAEYEAKIIELISLKKVKDAILYCASNFGYSKEEAQKKVRDLADKNGFSSVYSKYENKNTFIGLAIIILIIILFFKACN